MKKILAISISILILGLSGFLLLGRQKEKAPEIAAPAPAETAQDIPSDIRIQSGTVPDVEIADADGLEIRNEPEIKLVDREKEMKKNPESSVLKIPFISQAPFSEWDALHEDACEEASLLMLKMYMEKKPSISKIEAEREIQSLVGYEEKNGYGKSITLDELAKIAKKYYKLENPRVESDVTVEKLRWEIAAGRPVIVPAAGKILPNPNFKNGGPNYHMLVLKGYDAKGFITNDPGTRKGENFRYSFDDLIYAIHDWDEKNILNGKKAYLVFD